MIYGTAFKERQRAMGIRDNSTAPRSPWQNLYAERLIGSIRGECLDHLVAMSAAHLRLRPCYAGDLHWHRLVLHGSG